MSVQELPVRQSGHVSAPPPHPGMVPVVKVIVRSMLTILGLTILYFIAPMDRGSGLGDWLTLAIGLAILGVAVAFQLRRVMRSKTPGAQAVLALSVTIPLFLFLFAATYYLLSKNHPSNFSESDMTRVDALYFTVTVFATVGFGDITAQAQSTRVLVTVQMILDLLVIGAVVRVFFMAVESARKRALEVEQQPPEP